MNTENKDQFVYVPVSVEDELPQEKSICFRGEKKLLFEWNGENVKELKITHWLKKVPLSSLLPTEEVGIKEDDANQKKGIDLEKLQRRFDEFFENENEETFKAWLEKKGYVPSDNNNEGAFLASHSCAFNDSIQQKTFCESDVERFIRAAVTETAKGCLEFFEKDSVIKDKDGNILPDAWIHLAENPMPLTQRIYPRLEKHGIKFNSDKNTPESDTTVADSSNADHQIKKLLFCKNP